MSFSETFIRRPIATSLLMVAVAMFGAIAYHALPVSDLPQVDYPTISVSASLPGGSPQTMASAVATPLERQFTTIAGLDSMISSSRQGSTNITLQFDLDRDIDGATVDVETALAEAMPLLPPMPTPPSFRKVNPGDMPVINLAVTSPTLRLSDLDAYAETMIAQRISMIPGVAQVVVYGAAKYAVRVQVDPTALAARRLGLDDVERALSNWNVNLPFGALTGRHRSYNVQANGQLMRAADYRPVVVAYRNGAAVRLRDVARVLDSVEDDKQTALIYGGQYGFQGTAGVNLAVMRQPGTNTIEVTDDVKRLLPFFREQMPPAIRLAVAADRSKNIRESFRDIQSTMAATLALVVLVIFLFLRNGSATAIPALALPFSIVGTFAVMSLLHFSLNNISMMALVLCVGFVVDDAIVMLENIVRHMEAGETPFEAAIHGSREIGFTIVSMTLSLAAVFIPLLFMSGILGRLFREFAVTICAAILISGLVSITLTPMLCSRFLKPPHRREGGMFEAARDRYGASLRWVLAHRPLMLLLFLGVLGTTAYLYLAVPKGFIPETDNDMFNVNLEAAQGTSYYQMVQYSERAAKIISSDPDVSTFFVRTGGSGGFGGASNTSTVMVNLLPRRQRKATVGDIVNRLRPQLALLNGLRATLSIPQAIRVGGRMARASYDYTLVGPDTEQLFREAPKLERTMARLPGLVDVVSDLQIKNPQAQITIDRDRAAAFGIHWQGVAGSLYDAFGPQLASTIYAPDNQYRVLLELLPEYRQHLDALKLLYLRSIRDEMIPLDTISKVTMDAGPMTIPHSGLLPSVTLSFGLRPGFSLGEATNTIEKAAQETLSPGITGTFQGTAKVFQDSMRNMGLLLVIAILVVYIVLGMLY